MLVSRLPLEGDHLGGAFAPCPVLKHQANGHGAKNPQFSNRFEHNHRPDGLAAPGLSDECAWA